MVRRKYTTRLPEKAIINGGEHNFQRHKKQCVVPFDEEIAYDAFRSLERAVRATASFGTGEDDDDHQSTFVYTYRRLQSVFNTVYEDVDKDHRLPIQGEILHDMGFNILHDKIGDRTVTVEKTRDELRLTYQHGFKAKDETISVPRYESDKSLTRRIRACGKGIGGHHAPYNPSIGEKWRRTTPSKVSFSIGVRDDVIRLGIANTEPAQPTFWYSWYDLFTQLDGPYANVTFSMDDQTSVVQFVNENNTNNE